MCAKPVRQMCAKPAENRPSDSSRGNGKDPARSVRGPAAGLSVSPFGPSVTVLLAPLLPVCLAFCSPLGYRFACPFATRLLARLLGLLPVRSAIPRPIAADRRARVQITPSERRTAPHGTARPSALDIPLCARPFATRLLGLLPVRSAIPRALGLGYPLATPRRAPLPARTATPRPIAADRRARVQITPSERRTAPHGTARPSALDIPLCARPRPAVKLTPQRVGGGIRDICHQPPRIPRINVARQLRNG